MADLDGNETRHKILFCDACSSSSRSVSSDHAVTEEGVQHLHLGVLPGTLASPDVVHLAEPRRRGDGPGHETQLVQDGVPVPVHLHVAEDLAPVLLQFLEALDDLFAILAGLEQTHPRLHMLLQESQDVALLGCHISEVAFAWKPMRSAGIEDNCGAQPPGNNVQQTCYLTAKDGLAPYHARTLGKRLAWASEVPKHYLLADDFIKPFCNMEGAPVCSSTRVSGTLCLRFAGGNKQSPSTGWDAAAASSLPDNGQLHLKAVHGHQGASRGWPKTRINQGEFNKYMDSLEMEYNPGTDIKPQPPEMKMSAMDLVPCADKDEKAKPKAFMTEMCKLVPLKEASSTRS